MKTSSLLMLGLFVLASIAALMYGLSNLPAPSQAAVPDEVQYVEEAQSPSAHAEVKKIVYKSGGDDIYALLSVPKTSGKHPAFIILPAQSIPKEDGQRFAGSLLNSLGFAAFSIDERGQGETKARPDSIQNDFYAYAAGKKTSQQKMVDDVLNAFSILKSRPEIDPSRIYVWGESMGGRFAVTAAAQESRIAGVVLVSTSGYGFGPQENAQADEFLASIDPLTQIGKISPRKVIIIHSKTDNVIPIASAQQLYAAAKEPKKFFAQDGFFHGYLNNETGIEKIMESELKNW